MSFNCQVEGHSAATVMSPNGGMLDFSGMMSNIPSMPQKDGGNFGQTNSAFTLEPSGGKARCPISFSGISKVLFSMLLLGDKP